MLITVDWRSAAEQSCAVTLSGPAWPPRRHRVVRRRLQPGAVAGGGLGRGRRPDAGRRRDARRPSGCSPGPALEPGPGEYELDWLGRVSTCCTAEGIAVDLATATASPPPWLARRRPGVAAGARRRRPAVAGQPAGVLPVLDHATASARWRWWSGSPSGSPATRQWCSGTSATSPATTSRECFCDRSAERFRDWLAERYGDLDALNAAWGTAFWSQRYADWAEVLPPRATPTFPNPAHRLDWHRFCSDELLGQYLAERDGAAPALRPSGDDELRRLPADAGLLVVGAAPGRGRPGHVPGPGGPAHPRGRGDGRATSCAGSAAAGPGC